MATQPLQRLLQLNGISLSDGSVLLSLHPDGSRLAAARGPTLCICPLLPVSPMGSDDATHGAALAVDNGNSQDQALRERQATHGSSGPSGGTAVPQPAQRFTCPAASGPPTISPDDITALAWLAFARPPSVAPGAGQDAARGRSGGGGGGEGGDGSRGAGAAAQGWSGRSASGRRQTTSSGGAGGVFASIQVMLEDHELQRQQQTAASAAVPQYPHPYSLVVLLSGTRGGALQLHHANSGAVLLRQQLHSGPVVSIAVRTWRMGLNPSDAVEDVTVGWADAVVRLAAWELRAAATTCYAAAAAAEARARAGGGGSGSQTRFSLWGSAASAAPTGPEIKPLVVQKWEMPPGPARSRSSVVCCGQRPRDLYSLLQGIGSSSSTATGKTIFLAGGSRSACLAALEVDEQSPGGGGGALSYISSVATSVWGLARTARSVAAAPLSLRESLKSFVMNPLQLAGGSGASGAGAGGGGGFDGSGAGSGAPGSGSLPLACFPDAASGQRPPATAVWRQHRDDGRAVRSLAPSPHGAMVAAVDSLGRVLLVEVGAMLASRMWKGYRDAQVAWMEVPASRVAQLQQRQRASIAFVTAATAAASGLSKQETAPVLLPPPQQQQQQHQKQQEDAVVLPPGRHSQAFPPGLSCGVGDAGADVGGNDCGGGGDADQAGLVPGTILRQPPPHPHDHRGQCEPDATGVGSQACQDTQGTQGILRQQNLPLLPQDRRPGMRKEPGATGLAADRVDGGRCGGWSEGEYVVLLVVYAPRRQMLELWFPLQGDRLAAVAAPPRARLLQRGGGGTGGGGELGTWRAADAASAASPPMTPTGCMLCFLGAAPRMGLGMELGPAGVDSSEGMELLDVGAVFGLT